MEQKRESTTNRPTQNRLNVILAEKNVRGKALAKQLGVAECTVTRWRQNINQPSGAALMGIAHILGVEPSEIITTSPSDNQKSL